MKISRPLSQYAVKVQGLPHKRNFLLVHGYGCNQGVWKAMTPFLEKHGRVISYDHIGSGNSDYKLYSRSRYSTLSGYGTDLIEICDSLKLENVVVVGHSVGATIAALACIERPELFSSLVMIAPSPCYINDQSYQGGFHRWELDQLMDLMESDFVYWTEYLTPILLGRTKEDEKVGELRQWFCQIDRDIAKHFARVTFFSDYRQQMRALQTPALILQCTDDVVAPMEVGKYLSATIPTSTLVELNVKGHCPHITHPYETYVAMQQHCLTSGTC